MTSSSTTTRMMTTCCSESNLVVQVIPEETWREASRQHAAALNSLLYPPGGSKNQRQHSIRDNPLYNFLHRYYKFSREEILRYSPGLGYGLEGVSQRDIGQSISSQFLSLSHTAAAAAEDHHNDGGGDGVAVAVYDPALLKALLTADGKYKTAYLYANREILRRTISRTPFFSCYGMHEWAMLYSGGPQSEPMKRHQEAANLRVSQQLIDEVVEAGWLKCTHFDAWRFFHPVAQPMNMLPSLTRGTQKVYEQPGCLHATMDLFKYAYQLFPFVSSDILRETVILAFRARRLDIRGSPYDVSEYLEGEPPIRVETEEGREEYVREQTALAEASIPVRKKLLEIYDKVLDLPADQPLSMPSRSGHTESAKCSKSSCSSCMQ
eukprot:gene2699-2950_t